MPVLGLLRSAALFPLLVAQGLPAAAQPAPVPTAAALATAPGQVTAAPLSAEQLERLLEPFAGAPQDVLAVVLDACRYPTELMDATQWAARPEAERGPVKESWPPPVRLLAERAPRTLQFLSQDIASTAALGSAFQSQPNDVWLAFGRVTLARQAQADEQQPASARSIAPEPAPAQEQEQSQAGAPAPAPQQSEAAQPTSTPPVKAPVAESAPVMSAPAGTVPMVVQAPPTTVVTTPAPVATVDPVGSALVGGMVGLGAGLLISELAHDNNDYWGAPGYGNGYRPPYAVPPPYAPYGGARYDTARAAQADRQAALSQRQQTRQASVAERREGSQAAAGERSQQRQAAMGERQANRQDSTAARQTGRQDTRQNRQQGRREELAASPRAEQRTAMASAGQERRAAATTGQRRPQPGAGQERLASAQRPPAPARQSRPAPQASSAPDWGPARGMSGGAQVSRSRAPSGGFAAAGGGGAGGARASGARAGGGGGGRGGRR